MFCIHCGKEMEDTIAVCEYCGTSMSNTKKKSNKKAFFVILIILVLVVSLSFFVVINASDIIVGKWNIVGVERDGEIRSFINAGTFEFYKDGTFVLDSDTFDLDNMEGEWLVSEESPEKLNADKLYNLYFYELDLPTFITYHENVDGNELSIVYMYFERQDDLISFILKKID